MNNPEPFLSLFGMDFYPYGAATAVAAILGMLVATICAHAKAWEDSKKPSILVCGLVLIPCALIGARLFFCLGNWPMILAEQSPVFVLQLWRGGYSMAGALTGGIVGAFFYARKTGIPFRELADTLTPGAGMVIIVMRLGEYFTDQGLGHYVLNPQWQIFPFAVQNSLGQYQLPVFLFEAAGGLMVLLLPLIFRRERTVGGAAAEGLLFLCVSQILLESLREDATIRFGFIGLNQVFCAVGVAALLALYLVRRKRAFGIAAGVGPRVVGYLVCLGMLVLIQLALDRAIIENQILYGVMGGTLVLLYLLVGSARTERKKLAGVG